MGFAFGGSVTEPSTPAMGMAPPSTPGMLGRVTPASAAQLLQQPGGMTPNQATAALLAQGKTAADVYALYIDMVCSGAVRQGGWSMAQLHSQFLQQSAVHQRGGGRTCAYAEHRQGVGWSGVAQGGRVRVALNAAGVYSQLRLWAVALGCSCSSEFLAATDVRLYILGVRLMLQTRGIHGADGGQGVGQTNQTKP